MAEDCEIICAVIVAISDPVLLHNGIENPMQPVFDTPMRTSDLAEAFGRQRCAEQVIGALGRCLGCGLSGADHFSYGRQTRPSMTPLQPVYFAFFFQAEDGIRDYKVTRVQTCDLPI